jgi:hypothetical protein
MLYCYTIGFMLHWYASNAVGKQLWIILTTAVGDYSERNCNILITPAEQWEYERMLFTHTMLGPILHACYKCITCHNKIAYSGYTVGIEHSRIVPTKIPPPPSVSSFTCFAVMWQTESETKYWIDLRADLRADKNLFDQPSAALMMMIIISLFGL